MTKKILSLLLAFCMILGCLPTIAFAAEPASYAQITTLEELVSGQYVLVLDTGYAPDAYASSWISCQQPTIADGTITANAWTLTVTETGVKLADSNGVYVAPKGGNANGITEGEYEWAVSCADGKFQFAGVGSDTVILASNTSSSGANRFRAYKSTTVNGTPATYPCQFSLYQLAGATTEPDPTEESTPSEDPTEAPTDPEVTEPEVTEEPTEEPTEPELTIVPVSEAVAGADGATFMVKGVVTLVDGSNIYVQDETGAICVRMSAEPSDIALGDTIIGTGSKTTYKGMPQLGSGTYEKSEGMTLTAKETTIDALTAADICSYVKLSGLEVTVVDDNNGAYTTPSITLSDGTNTIQIYKAVVAKTDGTNWDVQVGDIIDVTAAVGIYNTTYQLRNTLSSEITVVVEAPDPTEPEVTEPEVTEPEVTEPEVTEPEVTEPEVTEPEVTEPEVTEAPSEPGESAEATLTFDDTAKRTEFSTEQQTWEENGIRAVNAKASSTTNIADYAGPVRFYKNSTLAISYAGGNISKIVFTCSTAAYASTLASSIGSDAVADGTSVTYTLAEAAKEVTITMSGGQVRMNSLTVTYVADTGSEPTEPAVPEITGVSFANADSAQYDAATKTFYVKADGTGDLPILTITGNYLDAEGYQKLFFTVCPGLSEGIWLATGDSTTMTFDCASLADYVEALDETPYEIEYTNDGGQSWIETGYYVVLETEYEFDPAKTGIYLENGKYFYYVAGEIQYGAGLIELNGNYYYIRSSGYAATGSYWVSNSNGLIPEGMYTFREDGVLEMKHGIVEENGTLFYYQYNVLQTTIGLMQLDGEYYYVRSNGQLAVGRYWITSHNNLLPEGMYYFNENGVLEMKHGIVEENGGLFYYQYDQLLYGAGLIELDGNYYYVRSNGQLATGEYYITTTNSLMEEGYYTFGEDGKMIP